VTSREDAVFDTGKLRAATDETDARQLRRVVVASAAGTTFEWYDFFIFGSLASIIAKRFFTGVDETSGFIFALLVFAAGFAVRPLGALVFGHVGDRLGRKGAFIVTISLMGLATFAIGLLPTFDQVGIAAPILLVALRICQGFAIGGEYGGAAIYVAEHAKAGRRGYLTSWIQTSAAFGLGGALIVILVTRTAMGEEAFTDWGWRIPFLLSIGLFALSLWIRLKLEESPLFRRIQARGEIAKSPLAESFFQWRNLRIVLVVLFALMAAQGTVWYSAYFYGQFFLERVLKVEPATVNGLLLIVVAVSAVLYVFFGWLSDYIGRKPPMVAGMLVAAVTFFPGFQYLTGAANPKLAEASRSAPVVVIADPGGCSFQFDPIGRAEFTSACDIAKRSLATAGVSYRNETASVGSPVVVRIGAAEIAIEDDAAPATALERRRLAEAKIRETLIAAGYPERADPALVNRVGVLAVLIWFIACATALYGPLAAALVELFPTRIRYTALSLPYHIGTGWFGGFMPATAFAIVAATGNIYAGLWYPVIVAGVSFVLAMIFLPETKDRNIDV